MLVEIVIIIIIIITIIIIIISFIWAGNNEPFRVTPSTSSG